MPADPAAPTPAAGNPVITDRVAEEREVEEQLRRVWGTKTGPPRSSVPESRPTAIAKTKQKTPVAKDFIRLVLTAAVIVVLIIGSAVGVRLLRNGADGTPHGAASELRIGATLIDFINEVPILKKLPMETKHLAKGGATHSWSNVSTSGQANSIIMTDWKDNGAVDYITMCLVVRDNDEGKTGVEAMAIAYKITSLAAGVNIDADDFGTWFSTHFNKKEKRMFGSVLLSLSFTPAPGGGLVIATIE